MQSLRAGRERFITDHFRLRIVSRAWLPLRIVPSAYSLAVDLSVPRQVVNAAYDLLEEESLVAKTGQGRNQLAYVSPRANWLEMALLDQMYRKRRMEQLGYVLPVVTKIVSSV